MVKIMIVEDDLVLADVLKQEAKVNGYEVVICKDGLDAFNQLILNPNIVDCLIVDYMMPLMGACELIMVVRVIEKIKHLPILVVSGKVTYRILKDTLDIGATAFQKKPLSSVQIKKFIEMDVCNKYSVVS